MVYLEKEKAVDKREEFKKKLKERQVLHDIEDRENRLLGASGYDD